MSDNKFNPTATDLLMIESLIQEINSKKNRLIERKIIIQNSLTNYKSKYQGVAYKSKEFDAIKHNRLKLKESLNEIELQIRSLNEELKFKNTLKTEVEFHVKNNSTINTDVAKLKAKLVLLRTKYAFFTKDKTRVASLRIMAAEFVDELDKILK